MKYLANTALRAFLVFGGLFGALMGVFAIERIENLLLTAIEYETSSGVFFRLYVFYLPRIMGFLLPVAVLTAVYFVLLEKRENRELVALASSGRDFGPVAWFSCLVAGLFFLISVIVSGIIQPMAALAYRAEIYQARAEYAGGGPRSGHFMHDGNNVFYLSEALRSGSRALRVFQFNDGGKLDNIVVSDCSRLNVSGGVVLSSICGGTIYTFADAPFSGTGGGEPDAAAGRQAGCRLCSGPNGRLDVARLSVGNSLISFSLNNVVPDPVIERRSEIGMISLLATKAGGAFKSILNAREAMADVMLALACALSVVFAIPAVAYTSQKTRFYALPAAIGATMVASIAFSSGILLPARLPGLAGFLLMTVVALALLFAAILAAFRLWRNRLLMPALNRA